MSEEKEPTTPPDISEYDEASFSSKPPPIKADGTWANAPGTVKVALAMDAICVLMGVLFFVNGAVIARDPDGLFAWIVQTIMGVTYILVGAWLFNSVRWGEKPAYNAQMSLAVISTFCCPIGTFLTIGLFAGWGKPDVKTWFDMEN